MYRIHTCLQGTLKTSNLTNGLTCTAYPPPPPSKSLKPSQKHYVNAGVYVIKSNLIKNLKNEYLHVTDFFKKLIKKRKIVTAFALHEDWSDIGVKKNYEEFVESK